MVSSNYVTRLTYVSIALGYRTGDGGGRVPLFTFNIKTSQKTKAMKVMLTKAWMLHDRERLMDDEVFRGIASLAQTRLPLDPLLNFRPEVDATNVYDELVAYKGLEPPPYERAAVIDALSAVMDKDLQTSRGFNCLKRLVMVHDPDLEPLIPEFPMNATPPLRIT